MRKIAILFTLLSTGLALSQPEGTLRLYTSQPDADAAATAAAFEAAYPDVNVTVFRSGTEQVIARFLLEVEAGEPGADVLLLADAPTFELLKERSEERRVGRGWRRRWGAGGRRRAGEARDVTTGSDGQWT